MSSLMYSYRALHNSILTVLGRWSAQVTSDRGPLDLPLDAVGRYTKPSAPNRMRSSKVCMTCMSIMVQAWDLTSAESPSPVRRLWPFHEKVSPNGHRLRNMKVTAMRERRVWGTRRVLTLVGGGAEGPRVGRGIGGSRLMQRAVGVLAVLLLLVLLLVMKAGERGGSGDSLDVQGGLHEREVRHGKQGLRLPWGAPAGPRHRGAGGGPTAGMHERGSLTWVGSMGFTRSVDRNGFACLKII